MAVLRRLLAGFRSLVHKQRVEQEMDEELREYLETAAEHKMRTGMPRETAMRAARVEMGGAEALKERVRDGGWESMVESVWRDILYAMRMLWKAPGFTLVAVLSLAIGIGANTAVFSFAETLLLRPLPVPRSGELLTVGSTDARTGTLVASYRDYVDIRDRNKSFAGLAAYASSAVAFATEPDASPRLRLGMLVSGNLFPIIGVEPHLGRAFRPEEDQVPGRNAVVMLGHDFWQQQFGGDPSVLGRTVRLNGIAFTVIGVTPPEFTGLAQFTRFQFYAPLMMWPRLTDRHNEPLEARDFRNLEIKGRLAPGVTMSQAQTELSIMAVDLERAYADTNRNQRMTVRTELQNRIANAPPVALLLVMLTMLAAAVLFVACANVAGLLTSRAPLRAREMALRLAIGAGRRRVIRQLITESVVTAIMGGVLGLGLGYAALALFRQIKIPTDLPIVAVFEFDRRALVFSLAVALVSAVLFGLAPAIRSTRADLSAVMKATDAAGPGGRRRWGRALLVVGQVAVSVVLLVVATFIYRGFQRQLGTGPGFRTDHLLMMSLAPRQTGYSQAQAEQFFERLAEQARRIPGVQSAALTRFMPMDGLPPAVTIVPEGFQFPVGTESATHASSMVDEHYFDTIGLSMLRGRGFHATDSADAPKVAVVNDVLAQRYWPGLDPIGKRFRLDDSRGPWVEIVGLVKATKYGFLIERPKEFVYLPFRQRPPEVMFLLTKSLGEPASLVTPLRELVRSLDANLPISNVRTMEELYRMRSVDVLNVILGLISGLGMMGLALAIVGLYGLVAYAATRRTKEIGIRMAIGAGRSEVLRMVLKQGMGLAVAGLGAGLLASIGVARALGAVFPGGSAGDGRTDMVAFPLVAVTVLAVTLLATYVPARRASRIDPTQALRTE